MNDKSNSVFKYKGIIVSETHWDREWYLSFQEFRRWLVRLIDDLIDNFPKNPEFHSFMMDGQTVVLEDYYEVRPERKEALTKLIQDGRVIIGPFYVLADEFLESGEGMIRNLLYGHQISEAHGVKPMKVGYVPDTFGHIWQLPQILKGFGINSMFYFRGYPPVFGNHEEYKGKNEDTPLEHWYQSPDGSKVLTLHAITGYGNLADIGNGIASFLVDDDEEFPYMAALMRISEEMKKGVPRRKTPVILFMNGSDHLQAEWFIPDLIKRWNSNEDLLEDFPIKLKHGTMEEYFEAVKDSLKNEDEIPTITGEARGSMYTQVTPGCISTRMNLKLENWKCTRELEKYAEPFSTMSELVGAPSQQAFIDLGWKWLIKNHPHDSICGCSLDRVHEDMITRFNWSMDNAADSANYACANIISGLEQNKLIAEFKKKLNKEILGKLNFIEPIIAFNPHPYEIKMLVEDFINVRGDYSYKLYSLDGKEIDLVNAEYIPDYRENIEEGQYLFKRFQKDWSLLKLAALLDDIPAFGYKVYMIVGLKKKNISEVNKTNNRKNRKNEEISELTNFETITSKIIKTKNLEININKNGSLKVKDTRTGHIYNHLNIIEDLADDGDEYDYAYLKDDKPILSLSEAKSIEILKEEPIFTEIKVETGLNLPKELIGDSNSIRVRSKQTIYQPITIIYRFIHELDRIDIRLKTENLVKGHRLRALFPANFSTTHSYADDHFMVMKRSVELPKDDGWYQDMQGIYHVDTFVDLVDDSLSNGISVFNQGLCEYEIIKDYPEMKTNGHSIALTIYRSVAWLSQNGHTGRKSGLNGPNLQTPGAQMMNYLFDVQYSIYIHQGDWEKGNVYENAYAYYAPARWFSFNHRFRNEQINEELNPTKSFILIDNKKLICSSIKSSQNIAGAREGMILRVFNPTNSIQNAKIYTSWKLSESAIVNLLEQDEEKLDIENIKTEDLDGKYQNFVSISVKSNQIFSIRLK